MFETSVVRARGKAARGRPLLLTMSVGAHAAAIIGVVTMSVASVTLPSHAPHQVSFPVIMNDLKPLLGDGNPKPRVEHAVTKPEAPQKPLTNTATMAPNNVPEHVIPAGPPSTTVADTGPASNATGPATDATGPGVPWGTKDGVVTDGPPATTTTTPTIYRISDGVKAPVVLRRITPPYPEIARRMHMNGFVIVECIIDRAGNVRDAHVLRSSFAAFEQPALDAVTQWKFSPGTLNNAPVDVVFDLTVTFQLH